MARFNAAVRETSFWLRAFALVINIFITILWQGWDQAPVTSRIQQTIFFLTVPGYTVILAVFLCTAFLEPLGDLGVLLYLVFGTSLYTITATFGLINYLAFNIFHWPALCIVLLIAVNSTFLTADALVLERARTMESVAHSSPSDPVPIETMDTSV